MKTMTYRKGKTIWKRAKVNRHEISLCNYFGRGSFKRERDALRLIHGLSYFITEEEDDDAEGDVEGEVEDEEEDA